MDSVIGMNSVITMRKMIKDNLSATETLLPSSNSDGITANSAIVKRNVNKRVRYTCQAANLVQHPSKEPHKHAVLESTDSDGHSCFLVDSSV